LSDTINSHKMRGANRWKAKEFVEIREFEKIKNAFVDVKHLQ